MTVASVGNDRSVQKALEDPSREVSRVEFEFNAPAGVEPLYKADDDDNFVIWGPASVPIVDRENDRIKAKALKDALPQLLKRASLSYEHTDQIVGEILTSFKTEEPREVEIQGETYKRQEFPTDVLDYPGMDEPAMYVAGKVYGDTRKSKEVREAINKEEIRSYSVSGEAIMTEMAVEDGVPVTDILKMDLSAVTLCRQGMNQKAKFGLVSKSLADPSDVPSPAAVATRAIDKHLTTMSDNDNDTDELEKTFAKVLDDRLPEGDLATVDDVEKTVDERFEELTKEDDGFPEEDASDETDEVPEGPEGAEAVDVESDEEVEKSFASKLKANLPSDQWDTIAPVVKDCMDGDEVDDLEVVEPEDEVDEEPVDPIDEMDMKSLGDLDPEEAESVAKSLLSKAEGETPASGADASATEPAHQQETSPEENIEKTAEAIESDPVMAGMMDENGEYVI